jgi:hypothetical protein
MKTLLLILVLFCAFSAKAQIMHRVYIHPAQIASTDTIVVEVQKAIGMSCSLIDSTCTVLGNNINITCCYRVRENVSTVICSDTLYFSVGPLPAGVYYLNYKINASNDTSDVICRYPDLSDSSSITFTVGANSISNLTDELNIYPNPVVDNLAINLSQMHSAVNWQITSAVGRLLLHSVVAQPNFSIDVSALPPGLYFLQLTAGGWKVVKQFVKQ